MRMQAAYAAQPVRIAHKAHRWHVDLPGIADGNIFHHAVPANINRDLTPDEGCERCKLLDKSMGCEFSGLLF